MIGQNIGTFPIGTIGQPISYGEAYDYDAGVVVLIEHEVRFTFTPGMRLYWASEGYTTEAGDIPSQQFFDGIVKEAVVERSVSFSPESISAGEQFARFTLCKESYETYSTPVYPDADALQELEKRGAVNGWEVRMDFVRQGFGYQFRQPAFYGIQDKHSSTPTTLTITARDKSFKFDRNLLTYFAGIGGAQGDAAVEGLVRPLLIGQCFNVPLTLINSNFLIYAVSQDGLTAVTEVRDRGVAIPIAANYNSFAALQGASIPAGQCATCLAEGLIRFNSRPAGVVTCDASSADNTVRKLIERLLLKGGATQSDYLVDNLNTLEVKLPYAAGMFYNSQISVAAALIEICKPLGILQYSNRQGQMLFTVLERPTIGQLAPYNLSAGDIKSVRELEIPSNMMPPPSARLVCYRYNFTVQSPQDLASSVTADNVRRFGQEMLIGPAYASNAKYPLAKELPAVKSCLVNRADAVAVATRLVDLFINLVIGGNNFRMFEVVYNARGFQIEMNSVVPFTLGNLSSSVARAFPVREDYIAEEVTAVLWGL